MLVISTIVALIVGFAAGMALRSARAGSGRPDSVEPATQVRAVAAPSAGNVSLRVPDASLAEAVNHLDLSVVICDRAGDVTFRNRPALAMQGTHVGVLVDDHVDEALASARSGETTDRRLDLHGPPRVSFELRAVPLDGGAAVALVNDVSERTRIDAMRTDFVANISHELKTPIGAIAVLAEAVEDETDTDVIAMMSGRLVEESHRAATTIDDLLELATIESATAGHDVVDLSLAVSQAMARGRAIDPSIEVEATEDPIGITIAGDARQLTSAIGNLVENAVKYSEPGGIVRVRTHADESAVEVTVSDRGVGIPHRDLDRVFERFYRVDRARSRTTGGTGLGLAIVRHVATNHGGEVLVSSEEGEGSTFTFRLPASVQIEPGGAAPTTNLEVES